MLRKHTMLVSPLQKKKGPLTWHGAYGVTSGESHGQKFGFQGWVREFAGLKSSLIIDSWSLSSPALLYLPDTDQYSYKTTKKISCIFKNIGKVSSNTF